MAGLVARITLERGLRLCPHGISEFKETRTIEAPKVSPATVELYGKENHMDGLLAAKESAKAEGKPLVLIDFTAPSAVQHLVPLYVKAQIPFVMGTTGWGDQDRIKKMVEDSGTYAVIAPNMNKQIVAFQSMIADASKKYPGCFNGYKLSIKESHQKTKKDISGTAKAVAPHMVSMAMASGDPESFIEPVRDDMRAMQELGVPEDFLTGHAFHTYRMESQGAAQPECVFEFKHNICGRRSYCEGALDAASWLLTKMESSPEKKVYNMIDVLSEGGIE